MKILHVITSLQTGGAEKLMVGLLPRFQAMGHNVSLVVFDGRRTAFMEQLEAQRVRIISFMPQGGSVYHPRNLLNLIRLLRKENPDIVHTHNTASQLFGAIVSLFCKSTFVTTEHSASNRRRNWGAYVWIDRWMYSRYKHIICVSEQTAINLLRYLGNNERLNVHTIYNGIDYHKYAHASQSSDVRLLGKKIITNVANFRIEKDQPTLIKAMKYLPDDYHLCLVGDGTRRKEYEDLVNDFSLEHRIHFLGIRMDVPNILAASDYVVMCSHFEGIGLSTLEGMASGKPFLADDVDGLREIVKGIGVLFEHEDARGFADVILRLEYDIAYRSQIITQCQQKAKLYDIGRMAEKYIDVYVQLTSNMS